jgi:hypothetical protein
MWFPELTTAIKNKRLDKHAASQKAIKCFKRKDSDRLDKSSK